ncbi:hypothetical protein BJ878DRAFT_509775 [Calycina marina]|uniref:Uncharacterized protein n=1 Tax=Calycina marina TaxID=1763456 RepID=A0A9P7Z1H3_9HELO|nr:hypothetical protein BJ878DRAFT_509775 [Calycina marina]
MNHPPRSRMVPSQQKFPPMPRDLTFTRTGEQDLLLFPSSPPPSKNDIKPLPDPPALYYVTNQQYDTSPAEFKIPPKPDLMLHFGPCRQTSIMSFAQFHNSTLASNITLCPLPSTGRPNSSRSNTSKANLRQPRALSTTQPATSIFSTSAPSMSHYMSPISTRRTYTPQMPISPISTGDEDVSPLTSHMSAYTHQPGSSFSHKRPQTATHNHSHHTSNSISRSTGSTSSIPYFCEQLTPVGAMFKTPSYVFHFIVPSSSPTTRSLREKFEWYHSSGPLIRTVKEVRKSGGLKLVRCRTDEAVAVYAGLTSVINVKNPRRVFGMMRFLGESLGEEFDVYAVMSMLAIVERGRRVVEANRLNMGY